MQRVVRPGRGNRRLGAGPRRPPAADGDSRISPPPAASVPGGGASRRPADGAANRRSDQTAPQGGQHAGQHNAAASAAGRSQANGRRRRLRGERGGCGGGRGSGRGRRRRPVLTASHTGSLRRRATCTGRPDPATTRSGRCGARPSRTSPVRRRCSTRSSTGTRPISRRSRWADRGRAVLRLFRRQLPDAQPVGDQARPAVRGTGGDGRALARVRRRPGSGQRRDVPVLGGRAGRPPGEDRWRDDQDARVGNQLLARGPGRDAGVLHLRPGHRHDPQGRRRSVAVGRRQRDDHRDVGRRRPTRSCATATSTAAVMQYPWVYPGVFYYQDPGRARRSPASRWETTPSTGANASPVDAESRGTRTTARVRGRPAARRSTSAGTRTARTTATTISSPIRSRDRRRALSAPAPASIGAGHHRPARRQPR